MPVPPRPATVGSPASVAAVPAPRPAPTTHVAATATSAATSAATALVDDVAGVAWIVREITHVPGILRLRQGRLSFESTRGVLFDGTPTELALEIGRSPRAGLHVTADGERLRVCVVRPAGGVPPCRHLVERAADDRPATSGELGSWSVWRPLLAPEQPIAERSRARVRRAFTRHMPRVQGA